VHYLIPKGHAGIVNIGCQGISVLPIKQCDVVIENLWSVFSGIKLHEHIKPSLLKKVAHRFLIYFKMKLGSNHLWPKVYIPVCYYCESNMFIANAISKFESFYNEAFSKQYTQDLL